MSTTRRHHLDDVPERPTDLRAWKAWLPCRAVLTKLGCPDRLPELLAPDRLGWEDEGDLPSYLPAEVPGYRESIIGAANAPDIHYVLHAYQAADGAVVLLQLCEDEYGRRLTAWACVDQREAARISARQALTWGSIGLDFSLTAGGMPNEEKVIQADRAELVAAGVPSESSIRWVRSR